MAGRDGTVEKVKGPLEKVQEEVARLDAEVANQPIPYYSNDGNSSGPPKLSGGNRQKTTKALKGKQRNTKRIRGR